MRMQIIILASLASASPALAQSVVSERLGNARNDTVLNELRTAPVPKQASDLDTVRLASAQRERSASMDEKTAGLWQSWTVSICEGCGNTPHYKKTVDDDFANRKSLDLGGSKPRNAGLSVPPPQRNPPEKSGRSLYADLSTENISQIRRMPGQ